MKHTRLLLSVAFALVVLAVVATVRPTEAVCNAGMSYGDVMDCTLSAASEVDAFTFSGTSGESVLFRMESAWAPYHSKVTVKRPAGTVLCTQTTTWGLTTECVLDASGTFTIEASSPQNGTGNYSLYLVRTGATPSPAATSISYGDTTSSTIAAMKWYPYTFSGTSGEKVLVRLVEVSSALYPEMELRRPDGTALCYGSSGDQVQAECTLDATGTHTVWVHSNGAQAGDFKLYVAVTHSSPTETPTSISYGDVLTAQTQSQMKWHPFTFSGTNGEKVYIRALRTSGSYSLLMSLRRPDGTQLCSAYASPWYPIYGGELAAECTLNATGTHTIWMSASDGLASGAFKIYVAVLSSPPTETPTAITYGDVLTGRTQEAMRLYPYTFSGTSGEKVLIRVQQTGGSFYLPWMTLRRPADTDLCWAGASLWYQQVQIECTLDATGTHTIWIMGSAAADSGTYQLYLARMSATTSETATSMSYGDLVTGNTQAEMRWKPFTFSGTSGEKVLIVEQATNSSGSYLPTMVLRRPDGTELCSAVAHASYLYFYAQCTLDATGTYTIWMLNNYGTGSGTFSLHLARTSTPYSETSAPITYGSTKNVAVTSMHLYPLTFKGTNGDKLNISSSTPWPYNPYTRLSVTRPDGTELCATLWNGMTCTLDATGVPTLWAGSSETMSGTIPVTMVQVPILGATYSCNPVADPSFPSAQTGGVNPTSGDFTHSQDISVPGRGVPLDFKRTYHSGMPTVRALGKGWTHNWDMYVSVDKCGGDVGVFYPDGHGSGFVATGGGAYAAPDGNEDVLVKNMDNTYTLTTKAKYEYSFSTAGKLTAIEDRNGNTTTLSYDGSGYLQTVTDPGGRTLTFTMTGSKITQIALPLSRTVTFSYTGDQLTSVTDVASGTTMYAYNSSGITSVTDPNSHAQVTQIFDTDGRVVEQTDAEGGKACYKYGTGASYTSGGCPSVSPAPNASQTIVVDARGNKTTYETDTRYQMTKITNALGGVTEFTYNGEHRPLTVKDPLNHTTTYTYDGAGNVLTKTDPLSHTWTYTYNAFNDALTATDPLSHTTTNTYDADGNLATVTDHDSNVTTYTVDGNGQVTEIEDPLTHTTVYDYDAYGNRIEVTNGLNKTWTYAFDLGGRITSVTDPLTHVTTYTYNARNQVLTETNELSQVTTTTYDAKGNKLTVTDAESNLTEFEYDDADRLVLMTDAEAGETSYGYDANGNRTSMVNPRTKTTTYTYDALNRRTVVTDPLSQAETLTYDAAGRVTLKVDARGLKTANTYDNADRLTTVEYKQANDTPVSNVNFAYDNANRRTSMTDSSDTTTYGYDVINRVSSVARGADIQFVSDLTPTGTPINEWGPYEKDMNNGEQYAGDGGPIVINGTTYAKGLGTVATSDIRFTVPAGCTSFQAQVGIDDLVGSNGNAIFEVWDGTTTRLYQSPVKTGVDGPSTVSVPTVGVTTLRLYVNPNGVTWWDHAVWGDAKFICASGSPSTTSYTYDDAGRRTRITYPDSKTVDYEYDNANQLVGVTDWLTNETTYAYDDAGRVTTMTYPNGVETDYTYDDANRPLTVINGNGSTFSSFTYTLDDVGNRTQVVANNGTTTYAYDDLYRLTGVTYPGPTTHTYTFDAQGNRLTRNTDDYTYNDGDRMTVVEGVNYGYDNNGNQTSRGSDTFTFDHEDRMTQSVVSSVTSSSVYYGDGVRKSHTVNGTTTNYKYDVLAPLPVVIQDGTYSYVYGLDLISQTNGSGDQWYFSYDGLGSVTDLTDDGGSVTDTFVYDVFGAVTTRTGTTPTVWKFTGEQADDGAGDSGFYYLRARHYDPATGRFVGKDEVEFVQRYAYVGNNPALGIDPSGKYCPYCTQINEMQRMVEEMLYDFGIYAANNRRATADAAARGAEGALTGTNLANGVTPDGQLVSRLEGDAYARAATPACISAGMGVTGAVLMNVPHPYAIGAGVGLSLLAQPVGALGAKPDAESATELAVGTLLGTGSLIELADKSPRISAFGGYLGYAGLAYSGVSCARSIR